MWFWISEHPGVACFVLGNLGIGHRVLGFLLRDASGVIPRGDIFVSSGILFVLHLVIGEFLAWNYFFYVSLYLLGLSLTWFFRDALALPIIFIGSLLPKRSSSKDLFTSRSTDIE